MFNSRIKSAENIDLPTCGKLIRMAWTILRNQASTLIDRQEKTFDDEVEDFWDFGPSDFSFFGRAKLADKIEVFSPEYPLVSDVNESSFSPII